MHNCNGDNIYYTFHLVIFVNFFLFSDDLIEVIIYSSPDDPKRKNRGFAFLEYDSHKSASLAKRRLGTGRIKVWGCDIIVDWADPIEEPDETTMEKVLHSGRKRTIHRGQTFKFSKSCAK